MIVTVEHRAMGTIRSPQLGNGEYLRYGYISKKETFLNLAITCCCDACEPINNTAI
jgi:hypothetical protein